MTGKPAKNVAASVRQRLLHLRESQGGDYNTLLAQYAIERFLYRLSKSELAEHFILKGAMLFRVWSGAMHRPTRDLDLLGRGDPSPDAVANAIRHVIAAPVEDDGMTFDSSSIEARDIREAQEYGGIRVTLVARLGNARIPMQIDVGFGDAVTPGLSDEFGTDEGAQRLWREFIRRMQIDDMPSDLAAVVAELRDRIWPLLVQARNRQES